MKFSNENRIATVRGDQTEAWEGYLNFLRKTVPKHQQVLVDAKMVDVTEKKRTFEQERCIEKIDALEERTIYNKLDPLITKSNSQTASVEDLESFFIDSQDPTKLL